MLERKTISYIRQLQLASKENRLVIFAGAGTSCDAGIPLWGKLVNNLANSILPKTLVDEYKNDLLGLAQLYRESCDDKAYYEGIKNELLANAKSSNAIHEAVFDLNPSNLITTNYDNLFEEAALKKNRQYYPVCKDIDLPRNHGERMIIKMHGDLANDNIVLTENDYYDYSRNFPLIRSFVISQFVAKIVLFIGFSFTDINLKYILREIQSVLGRNMQKVYLLTTDAPSREVSRNFEEKGINIVAINDKEAKEIIDNLRLDVRYDNILSEKGQTLVNQLVIIKGFRENKDLVGMGIDYITTHKDEIRFMGDYLKYAFPDNRRKGFEIVSNEMMLPIAYRKEFEHIVSSRASLRAIIKQYDSNVQELRCSLLNNNISSIEEKNIYSKAAYRKIASEGGGKALSAYYEMDQIKLTEEINRLRKRTLSYTITDLELPYILFETGHFYEAYLLYGSLASIMWKKRKYTLFFLCIYNRHSVSWPAYRELENSPEIDRKEIIREHDKVDLMEELNLLPVSSNIRQMLTDLIYQQQITQQLVEASEKLTSIATHRKKAEEHTLWSMNNDASVLIEKFLNTFNFSTDNYLVADNSKYGTQLYTVVARGIFNSLMIPDEEGQSRLKCLFRQTLFLLVFKLEHNELKKVISDTCDGRKVKASEDAKTLLQTYVKNMHASIMLRRKDFTNHQVIETKILRNRFKNILLLCNLIEDCPKIPEMNELFVEYWKDKGMQDCIFDVTKYIVTHGIEGDTAQKLLSEIKYSARHDMDIACIIQPLTQAIKDSHSHWEDHDYLGMIEFHQSTNIAGYILTVLNKEKQDIVKVWIKHNIKTLAQLASLEQITRMHFLTPSTFDMYVKTPFDRQRCLDEGNLYANLSSLYDTPGYEELRANIEAFAKDVPFMQFLMNPITWNDYTNICPDWLNYVPDEKICEMAKIPGARKCLKVYAEHHPWKKELTQILWEQL